jgi:maltooligosyltrehalose synthase
MRSLFRAELNRQINAARALLTTAERDHDPFLAEAARARLDELSDIGRLHQK